MLNGNIELAAFFAAFAVAASGAAPDIETDLEKARLALADIHHAPANLAKTLAAGGKTGVEAIAVLDYIVDHPDDFPRHAAGNAVSALGVLGTPEAISRLEELLDSDDESIRWRATTAYQDAIFSREFDGFDPIERMKSVINGPLHHGGEIRQTIHYGFDMALAHSAPRPAEQKKFLRFLLDESLVDADNSRQLDEILCREVPKWRASPQRAANAAKMLREHPDDAALAAFFEGVRADAAKAAAEIRAAAATNALRETAFRLDDCLADPFFAATANVASTNAPVASAVKDSSDAIAADPWADLLSDLPEKKPWVPPEGYDPPF